MFLVLPPYQRWLSDPEDRKKFDAAAAEVVGALCHDLSKTSWDMSELLIQDSGFPELWQMGIGRFKDPVTISDNVRLIGIASLTPDPDSALALYGAPTVIVTANVSVLGGVPGVNGQFMYDWYVQQAHMHPDAILVSAGEMYSPDTLIERIVQLVHRNR